MHTVITRILLLVDSAAVEVACLKCHNGLLVATQKCVFGLVVSKVVAIAVVGGSRVVGVADVDSPARSK